MTAPIRLRPRTRRRTAFTALAAALASSVLTLPVGAETEATVSSGGDPVFPISHLEPRYLAEDVELPEWSRVLPVRVPLRATPSGYRSLRSVTDASLEPDAIREVEIGAESGPVELLHASALADVLAAVVARLQAEGLIGIYLSPDSRDIDVQTERDLRPAGRTALAVVASIGRVKELRSVALGDRIPEHWRTDHPLHRKIRTRSPVQPSDALRPGQTDVLQRDALEAYLFRLNRHPGRRVAAALSATDDGGIALDYRVAEAKPWYAYARVADTGTERTDDIQTTFGFVHNQVTDNDDTLQLSYTNGGIDVLHALHLSYEAPWFGPERPDWLKSDPNDALLGRFALPLDHIPWWGNEFLRWSVSGGWSRFEATDIAFGGEDFMSTDWNAGWMLSYNAFQYGAFFLDLDVGLRARVVETINEATGTENEDFLLLPQVGLSFERITEISSLRGSLLYETNVSSEDFTGSGRLGVDEDFHVLHYDIGGSFYLEPLLRGDAWRDPTTPWSSTLAHELALGARGQFAFGNRLLPQYSRVAGGLLSVRGYPQSAAVGDTTFLWSAEYRFHIPRSLPIDTEPLKLPLNAGPFRTAPQHVYGRPDWDLIFRAFVDAGRTIRHDRFLTPGSADDEQNETLVGAGLGLELRIKQNLTARVDWATALSSTSRRTGGVEAGTNEIHFLINVLY